MPSPDVSSSNTYTVSPFGVDIIHSQIEANQIPPECSAREHMGELMQAGDNEAIQDLYAAVETVAQVVDIRQETEDGMLELVDIFTAEQIQNMSERIKDYLGSDVKTYLENITAPPGYPYYVGRLATYFMRADDEVTTSFGAFETRHTDPKPNGVGPYETNSRFYANFANEELLSQLKSYYQAKFDVTLVGPQKRIDGGLMSWERGIAECQFLVLDYIRDQLVAGPRVSASSHETMTLEDIEKNLFNLLVNQHQVVAEVNTINPLLAHELNQALNGLKDFTLEVMHRGRLGLIRYQKEPAKARAAILRAEGFMLQAAGMAEVRADQEDIPILDF